MKCKSCGDILKVTHTENTATGAVKRRRECACGALAYTFERYVTDTLNEREQRLIDIFRDLMPEQMAVLWSFLRLIKQMENNYD